LPASSRSRTSRPTTGADGLLLVDKPAGVSSHDVVAVVRRALGEKRIGHGGTLDPFATGLLVLLVGRATRLLQYVRDEPKEYEAQVTFGAETTTEDLHGAVTVEAPLPTRERLEAALPGFLGRIAQVPPAYSAKRIDGQRAYALARAGQVVTLAPATIEILSLSLSDFEETPSGAARCRLRVACGGGTYVRSLARDLARAAGSAAHLTALRRHRAGVFSLARSIPLEHIQAGVAVRLAPPIDALEGYPVQPLAESEVAQVVRGIDVEARVAGAHAALIEAAGAGALVAFAERRTSERGDRWQPRVVMREPPGPPADRT
jgi:tRNA pseudouridine55 synthase